jgi:hypothetical protein
MNSSVVGDRGKMANALGRKIVHLVPGMAEPIIVRTCHDFHIRLDFQLFKYGFELASLHRAYESGDNFLNQMTESHRVVQTKSNCHAVLIITMIIKTCTKVRISIYRPETHAAAPLQPL